MKIAIVGTSDSAREAPFKDDSWRIWSLGRNHVWLPRCERWFQLHSKIQMKGTEKIYYDNMAKAGDRLFVREALPEFPNAKLFPMKEIKEKYGTYFTSSIAWMFGAALLEGATEIGIWGVDMRGDGEYGQQRPCMEYWIGRAIGQGIKVSIHHTSTLLKGEPYAEGMYYEILGFAKTAKDKFDKARDDACYQNGYSDALEMIRRRFG